jgi:two-component system LytT family response regulator
MTHLSENILTIIVDDEKPSREVLTNYINEYCPALKIVASCKTINEAYKAIIDYKPQLVFLDIEMPRSSGFGLLKMFSEINFNVVFITAFSEYASTAFRVSAIDFLLKPIKVSELIDAVNKVQTNIKNKRLHDLSILFENLEHPTETIKKLVVPHIKGFTTINISNIILCEADGYCTNFYLTGNTKVSSSHHLKYYEEFLPQDQFLRVHNSYVINLLHVTGYTHQGVIMLSEGITCSLGTSRKQAFLQKFNKYSLLRFNS